MSISGHSGFGLIEFLFRKFFSLGRPIRRLSLHPNCLRRTIPPPCSRPLWSMRYLSRLGVAAGLCAVPIAAQARIFTSPGWYSVVVNEHDAIDQVVAGPSAEKPDCDKDQLQRIVGDERTVLELSGAHITCVYLSEALALDT